MGWDSRRFLVPIGTKTASTLRRDLHRMIGLKFPARSHQMSRRILIADDNEKTIEQMTHLVLSEPDVTVDAARDGRQALELLEHANYSLFLTDLKMPGMDGMALVKAIRQRNLPVTVVVMTGFGSVDQAVEAMRLGAYDFLTKPVDPDHLRLVVQRALRER